MIEQLKALEQYLKANKMEKTIKLLRTQILGKYPQGPSSQFLALVDEPSKKISRSIDFTNRGLVDEKKIKKGNNQSLAVEGLLSKIAYSSKLLEDEKINKKIEKLMDNKIFIKAFNSIFPQAEISQQRQSFQPSYQFRDQLDLIEASNLNNSQIYQHQGISQISLNQEDSGILSHPSLLLEELNKSNNDQDEYRDDNDLGYYEYSFSEQELLSGCFKLQSKFGYPEKAVKRNSKKEICTKKGDKVGDRSKFPEGINFPASFDPYYPLEYNGVIYDILPLKVIFDRQKTGYEERSQLNIEKGDILAGRYRVDAVLGSGVFAKVLRVFDVIQQQFTCLKMISNNKDFLDQALDQIKILRYINSNCNPDDYHLLKFKGTFYHREHLFIQTDLLQDNLYMAYRKNPTHFPIPVLREIGRQILEALHALHSLQIMHADLKPENILIKSYKPIKIKVVDLGNSCFFHDRLGEYVQSRSYRAPEVVLGTGYDEKIDIWSVGCILAELWTKNLLFYNLSIQGMLARIQSIVGPWPEWMLDKGQYVENYFSKQNLIFFEKDLKFHILIPKTTTLRARIRTQDEQFLHFLEGLLKIDPNFRMSAQEALHHPFLQER